MKEGKHKPEESAFHSLEPDPLDIQGKLIKFVHFEIQDKIRFLLNVYIYVKMKITVVEMTGIILLNH